MLVISLYVSCPPVPERNTILHCVVGLISLKTGWYWCYANHISTAVLRSELNQHRFRVTSPDSAGPAVFEDQTP